MYDDQTAHLVLHCYCHWLYDIDDNEEYFLSRKIDDHFWHIDCSREIHDELYYAMDVAEDRDEDLIKHLRMELESYEPCLAESKKVWDEGQEDYDQHVSDMYEESWRIDDICTYKYATDTLILEPKIVYT